MSMPGGPALRPLVIAMDGPAGAGKSTVTRALAARLGILFLDTGAMYRACTVGIMDAGCTTAAAVEAWVTARRIDFDADGNVRIDAAVIPRARIRSPETTREIWRVADHPACRAHLVAQQQALVRGRDCVVEGRDATTVICPEAEVKLYVTASAEVRARRAGGALGRAAFLSARNDVAVNLAFGARAASARAGRSAFLASGLAAACSAA